MSETNTQEPTMEEILASIRRIISEDDPPTPSASPDPEPAPPAPVAAAPAQPVMQAAPSPPPAPADEDVLELTEPVDAPKPAPPTTATRKLEETLGDLDVFTTHEEPAPPRAAPPPSFAEEPLVGSYAAEASASQFGQLARSMAMPKDGRTLEDVVRELLKPLLRDWLDQHLSSIVEARVQAEVERISRRRDF